MSKTMMEDPAELLRVLPDEILSLRRFLLWKSVPHPTTPGKMRKLPFYANGKMRKNLLDTKADLDQLVSFEEALDQFLLEDFSGVGFALTGEGVAAFDFDNILDEEGNLLDYHPGTPIVHALHNAGVYLEISPSGRGLRAVGPCQTLPAYSREGVEWWSARRFVVLTGHLFGNPKGWQDLDPFILPLIEAAHPAKKDRDDDDDEAIVTPRVIEELRDALTHISADDYETWVAVGNALVDLDDKGRELWVEWSKTSKKWKDSFIRKWAGFRGDRTSYKSIFAKAQAEGWANPRKRERLDGRSAFAEADDEEDQDEQDVTADPLRDQIDLGEQKLHPTEFVLDGFLPAAVTIIAGAWGAGKSCNLIGLLASVAHIAPEEWGFRSTLRRHVVWVTEAPEQARDTLYSLAKEEGSADWQEFKDWFHLFHAKRREPKRLAKELKALVGELTYELENGFEVKPVVVLDTTTANLDLENESDNSMVAAAMATLKQSLRGIPLILIGHTPKAVTKAEIGEMTFRGAGAWEAEAAATYFLVYDQETEMRFLAIRKARFTPTYREIDFDNSGGSELIPTPWGEPQSKAYLHGVPTRSDGSARKAAREAFLEEQREEKQEQHRSERQERILEFVRECASAGTFASKSTIRANISGKNELVAEATQRLVEAELIHAHVLGPRDMEGLDFPGRVPEIFLPADVQLAAFLSKARATK
jgi:hypothetical protein